MSAGADLDRSSALSEIMDGRTLRTVFQPVLDLDTSETVGFEALARGPAGSPLERPDQLFELARANGRAAELDWLCRDVAVATARDGGLHFPLSLFVNADPAALGREEDDEHWRAYRDLRCYTEVTERDLARRPAELLRALDTVREQDWGIALDDIGAVPESLALMPLLRPDVLKLDMRLLTQRPDRESARIVHAVLTQAAETGAAVIAEGIEDEHRLDVARSYGVGYGQGYLLGRPAALPDRLPSPHSTVPLLTRANDKSVAPSPYALVATRAGTRPMRRERVTELMRQLLGQALSLLPEPLVLLTVPPGDDLTPELRALLGRLAARTPIVAVLGGGPALGDIPGIRRAPSREGPDDPVNRELSLAVISSFYAAALTAQTPLRADAGWDGVLTFDRSLAVQAATMLFVRLPPSADGPPGPAPD